MVGGVERTGNPAGYGAMATDVRLAPFSRSPSLQCLIPGTVMQSVHCQNFQPLPSQFWAGTVGLLLDVQCAIQRRVPADAAAVESPSWFFQKSGEV